MSKYTTNFKTLVDMGIMSRDQVEAIFKDYDLYEYLTPDEINVITTRGTWSKDKLARKIVDHYYLKDIGCETIGMFKHYAKIQMQEIMESKLPLIYSAAIQYDPLVNVDFTETLTRNVEQSSTSNGSGIVISSDTPQTNINKTAILNGSYASTASASDQEASGNNSTDEEYTKRVKGNSGVSATAQKMVEQYRDNIRAIDYEIIIELNDLFMGLF